MAPVGTMAVIIIVVAMVAVMTPAPGPAALPLAAGTPGRIGRAREIGNIGHASWSANTRRIRRGTDNPGISSSSAAPSAASSAARHCSAWAAHAARPTARGRASAGTLPEGFELGGIG